MLHYAYYTVGVLVLSLNRVHGQTVSTPVFEVSTCEDLHDILDTHREEKRIIITKNMRCSRDHWFSPAFVSNNTVIEGSKFGKGVPAIDWADSANSIIVQHSATLTFQNIVLIQDFVQLGGLRLSFATGSGDAAVRILGTGVGIRSCQQDLGHLIPIYESIPRPDRFQGRQSIEQREDINAVYVNTLAFVPTQRDNSTWVVCKSVFQCGVISPFQESFQESLNQETLEPTCGNVGGGFTSLGDDDDSSISGGSTSNSTFAAIVALFTALCTTLVLIVVFILFRICVVPLMRKKKKQKRSDVENPTPRKKSELKKPRKPRSRQASTVHVPATTVHLADIELGLPLGKGSMSTVYKGYYNDKPLAVKIFDMEASESVSLDDDPIGAYLAQRLYHANVIETLLYQVDRMEELQRSPVGADPSMLTGGSYIDTTTLSSISEIRPAETFQYRTFHVMEFCNLGTLEKAMTDGLFYGTDQEPRVHMILRSALDIAKGMRHLHSARIIHGQLRPSNVLLKGDAMDARGFICKVSDFGMTHLQEQQQALELTQGHNLSYRAPETLRRGLSEAGSDVFSFGMILWSMLTGRIPFSECEPSETVSTVLEGTRPEIPSSMPRKYERLIKDCWHADTSARPPFANIIERLSKIITNVVQPPESTNGSTPKHHRDEKSYCSSDADTVIHGYGSVNADNIFDTVEIHDTNSQ